MNDMLSRVADLATRQQKLTEEVEALNRDLQPLVTDWRLFVEEYEKSLKRRPETVKFRTQYQDWTDQDLPRWPGVYETPEYELDLETSSSTQWSFKGEWDAFDSTEYHGFVLPVAFVTEREAFKKMQTELWDKQFDAALKQRRLKAKADAEDEIKRLQTKLAKMQGGDK